MTWATIAALLAQYALPFVDKVVTKWLTDPKALVTAQEWADLVALANQTARTQMLAALSRAGIDPTSPQGLALLAQVPA